MVKFWLNNFTDLFSPENFKSTNSDTNKILNVISLLVLIVGIVLVFVTKKPLYFGVSVVILSFIIFFRVRKNKFNKF